MAPDWDKLKEEFADTPNVVVADVDCTAAGQGTCGEHGVQGYPTIKTIKDGKLEDYNGAREFSALKATVLNKLNPLPACSLESKDGCNADDLKILEASEKMSKGDRNAKVKEVENEIKEARQEIANREKEAVQLAHKLELIRAGGKTVDKVEQLLNDQDWRAHCEARICIVAFLPHILDDGAKGRNSSLKVLAEAMAASKKDGKNVGYVWSQGGDQFEMEEKMNLQFGFPAVVAVHFNKERYGIHRGTFDKESLGHFLTSMSRGGVPLVPLPKGLQAVKVDAWDGKDGEPPAEEEL